MSTTREELQTQAIDTLFANRNLIVNWGTGVGKSRVAILATQRLVLSERRDFLFLVAETAHKNNWKREFVDALGQEDGEKLFSMITIECYASLDKYVDTSWDMIVADEAHHLRSEQRTSYIRTLRCDYFLCLSATVSCNGDADALLRVMNDSFGIFEQLTFGVQDAIENKILGEPKIYVHMLPLEKISGQFSVKEEWGRSAKRKEVTTSFRDYQRYCDKLEYPDMSLTIEGTAKECYLYYCRKIESHKKQWQKLRNDEGLKPGQPDNNRTTFAYNRYIRYCSLRKKMIGQMKTVYCRWLIKNKLSDKKFICFCADVEQGRAVGGKNVICSENESLYGKGYNAEVIRKFNEDEIHSIFAVNMAQEGLNLKGIEVGVVVQLDGKDRSFIQKFGRALRAKYPVQHIIVVKDTHDEDYYKTAFTGIDKDKYVKTIKR